MLPGDIWVAEAHSAPPAFHPRYSATAREYGYRLGLTAAARSPFHRPWCWPLARSSGDTASTTADPDAEALHAAAALLPGEKSFAAFARAGQEHRGDRCTVTEARWAPWDLGMEFTILANRFLHHMVRYLVGTMVDIARGRRPLDEMRAMLEGNEDGLITSPPAPASGLFLRRVSYPAHAIAHNTAIPDDSATDSGNAATVPDAPPGIRPKRPVHRSRSIRFRHRPPTRRERQPPMKIFLDTADLGEIRRAAAAGLIDGVTTNPSLLARVAGDRDPMEIFLEICEAIDGPVSAEVVGVEHRNHDRRGYPAGRHPPQHRGQGAPDRGRPGGVPRTQLARHPGQRDAVLLGPAALLAAKAGAAYISPSSDAWTTYRTTAWS